MIETVNQIVGLAQAGTMYYPPGLAGRLKLASETTVKALPGSLRETRTSIREKIRTRSYGALALAGATAAQVYADDNVFYGIFSKVKEWAGNSTAAAWGVTSVVAAAGQSLLARSNQKRVAPQLAAKAYEPKLEIAPAETRTDRIGQRYNTVKEHAGKAGVTLFALGVPGHVLVEPMTKREVFAHGALWGLTAPAFYTVANVSLGALDNPAAPFGVAALLTTTRYINETWNRAGDAVTAQAVATESVSQEVYTLPAVAPNVA